MEFSSELGPSLGSGALNREKHEENEGANVKNLELETLANDFRSNHHFHSMSALSIWRETAWIFRFNLTGFMAIVAVLICPVSTVLLSNVLVNQSLVKRLSFRLLLVAKSSGLPLKPFIRQACHRLAGIMVSVTACFPLFVTLSLLSKAAVIYSVDCSYSRRKFESSKFYLIICKIWKRIVFTYIWGCAVMSSCLTLFLVLVLIVSCVFLIIGFPSDLILYPAMVVGLIFSVVFANSIIICNTAIVISVLEDVSGPQALLRASSLIKGQTQVGLLIFLGSTIGMASVEGLFQHRVKTLRYGDGSFKMWEGALLVVMYSFVVMTDSMMSTVFYFNCKLCRLESTSAEKEPVLEAQAVGYGSREVQ